MDLNHDPMDSMHGRQVELASCATVAQDGNSVVVIVFAII